MVKAMVVLLSCADRTTTLGTGLLPKLLSHGYLDFFELILLVSPLTAGIGAWIATKTGLQRDNGWAHVLEAIAIFGVPISFIYLLVLFCDLKRWAKTWGQLHGVRGGKVRGRCEECERERQAEADARNEAEKERRRIVEIAAKAKEVRRHEAERLRTSLAPSLDELRAFSPGSLKTRSQKCISD